MNDDAYQTHDPGLTEIYAKMLKPDQLRVLHHLRVAVGNIFPNLSFIETQAGVGEKALIIRQWHPVSGSEMEILSWVLAEKEILRHLQGECSQQRISQLRSRRRIRAGQRRALGLGHQRRG